MANAQRLYDHPVGCTDVRVAGDCGCPPPDVMAVYLDAKGDELVPMTQRGAFMRALRHDNLLPGARWSESPETEGSLFVASYHVDSELGLYLIAREIARLPTIPGRCPVCGWVKFDPNDPNAGLCPGPGECDGMDFGCFRRGYEREKARADALEEREPVCQNCGEDPT